MYVSSHLVYNKSKMKKKHLLYTIGVTDVMLVPFDEEKPHFVKKVYCNMCRRKCVPRGSSSLRISEKNPIYSNILFWVAHFWASKCVAGTVIKHINYAIVLCMFPKLAFFGGVPMFEEFDPRYFEHQLLQICE